MKRQPQRRELTLDDLDALGIADVPYVSPFGEPQALEPAPAPRRERTWSQAASDTGRGLMSGAAGLARSAGDLYGVATGDMDNALSQAGARAQEHWQEGYSPELKRRLAERQAAIDASEGIAGKFGTALSTTLRDPALLGDAVASNVATLVPGAFVGRGAAAATYARALAQGATPARAAQLAGTVGTAGAVATGAVQQGADVAGDVYQQALQKTPEEWAGNPEFVARVEAGDDPRAVQQELALDAARVSLPAAAAISGVTNVIPGATLLERALVGKAARQTLAPAARFGVPGAVARGAFGQSAQEAFEEGGGAYAGNLATRAYVNPAQDLEAGVGENAGLGAAAGLALGAVGGAAQRRRGPLTKAVEDAGRGQDSAQAGSPDAPAVDALVPPEIADQLVDARGVEQGDVLNPLGEPYRTKVAAVRALMQHPKGDDLLLTPVEGGFVLRPRPRILALPAPPSPPPAQTLALPEPVTPAQWEVVGGQFLEGPPADPPDDAGGGGAPAALPAPVEPAAIMVDRAGNAAPQPAVVRTDALNRETEREITEELAERERTEAGLTSDVQDAQGAHPGFEGRSTRIDDIPTLVHEAQRPGAGNRLFGIYRRLDDAESAAFQAHGGTFAGYTHGIDESAVRHVLKEHGDEATEAARGQVAVRPADFALVPEITDPRKADSVSVTADSVTYRKQINGTTFVVEEVRTGRKRLALKTMWKVRSALGATSGGEGVPQTPEAFRAQPPQATSSVANTGAERTPVIQNRNRATPASIAQMQSIARDPDYTRLGFSREFSSGAPVVAGDASIPAERRGRTDAVTTAGGKRIAVQYAVVEASELAASNSADGSPNSAYEGTQGLRAIAGNGRIAGVQQAYSAGSAAKYREELAGDDLHGIRRKVISAMRAPVLVRVMAEAQVTSDIGDISNQSGTLSLSATEQARNDARRVRLDALEYTEEGAITPQAVRRFVQGMPKHEQGALIDTTGAPTREAVDRLHAAVFSTAYNSDELVRLYAQAQDAEARLVMSALAQAAPDLARLSGAGALDIRGIVTEAAQLAVNARRRGVKLADIAAQADIAADPDVRAVLDVFAASPRSVKPIVEALRRAARFAYTEANKPDNDMFGGAQRATRADVLAQLKENPSERTSAQALEDTDGGKPPGQDAQGRTVERRRADEAGAVEAGRPAAASDSAEEGLTAPTPEELRARAVRTRDAQAADEKEQKRLADKARADGERGEFTLTGSNRPADVAAAGGQGGLFGGEPQTAKQPTREPQGPSKPGIAEQERAVYGVRADENTRDVPLDLFPETLASLPADRGADSRGRTRQPAAAGQGDLRSAAPVPNVLAVRQDPALPGLYHYSSQLVEVGRRELPVSRVVDWNSAALALSGLNRYAVEHFDVLVTDAKGKPLAIICSFKGATAQTAVHTSTLLAEALRIQGAARAWGVHNHPSGTETLSRADQMLTSTLERAFAPSSVEYMGTAAIGRSGGTLRYQRVQGGDISGGTLIVPKARTSVPVVERTIAPIGEDSSPNLLGSPDSAKQIAQALTQGNPGIVFSTAANRLSAWVPIEPLQAGALRENGRFDRLINSAAEAGAAHAIIANPNGVMGEKTLNNLASALALADVRVLDVLDTVAGTSAAERGTMPFTTSVVFSRSPIKSVAANIVRGKRAMNKALLEKADQHRAMYREGMGWIDFVWGDDRKGLQHIFAQRAALDGMTPEQVTSMLTAPIIEAIAKGREVRRAVYEKSTRAVVEYGDHEAVLVRNPGSNTWLLSGWEKRFPDANRAANDAPAASRAAADSSDGSVGAGNASILSATDGEARGVTPSSPTQAAPIPTRRDLGADTNEPTVAPATGAAIGASTGFDRTAIQRAVDALTANWTNAPRIEIIDALDDPRVPQAVRDEDARQRSQGADGAPEGFFADGTVYLVAPQLASAADVRRVVFHEALGHFGLRGLFGKNLATILDRFAALRGDLVRAAAERYGLDFDKPADRRIAAEEALARLAQERPESGWVRQAIAAIRNWLRANFGLQLKQSDNDIVAQLIVPARRFVERGSGEGLLKPLMSGADTADAVSRRSGSPASADVRSVLQRLLALNPDAAGLGRNDGGVVFSRATAAASFGALTPDQEASLRKVGAFGQKQPTFQERLQGLRANMGTRLTQAIADQFAPLKELDAKAYLLARMSKGADGTLEAAMLYGKPFLRDGVADVDLNDKGFAKTLAELHGEQDRFLWWVAAQRAERLKPLGLENLFGGQDIAALKTLNQSQMGDGTDRAQAYRKALAELTEHNDAALKVALDSGLIADEQYQQMRGLPYVPFYRIMDETGEVRIPRGGAGLVGQRAWKQLKGGKQQLNEDLLANTLQNWSHLYTAAAKNRAALASIDAAMGAGIAYPVPSGTKGSVKVMRDGVAEHYAVEDPYTMQAIAAVNYMPADWIRPLATFKRWLSIGVTANPAYKIRNLMRDSIAAVATADLSGNILKNVSQGVKAMNLKSQTRASLLAAGGIIRFGTQLEGQRSTHAQHLIDKFGGTVLDETAGKKLLRQLTDLWDAYQEVGDRAENVNRAALYEQLRSKGHSHAEAAFMSRDLLDFSMSGQAEVVRFLIQTVPFLNARIQGLYKLGRAAAENPHRFAAVTGAVALASLALMLAYEDDDDWKRREDFDRDASWWFKIGDTAYRIPKPFEVGAIGTLAERTWELMFNEEMDAKRFGQRLSKMLFSTFAFNPTPQIIKPMLDVYANEDSFTGRPIEPAAMERMRPQNRLTESTTMPARLLGSLGLPDPGALANARYEPLSPVQIDYLVRGYFGWLGATIVGGADAAMRPALARGERPDLTLRDLSMGFAAKIAEEAGNRYVSAFYEQLRGVEEAMGSYRAALKRGDVEEAQEVLGDEPNLAIRYRRAQVTKKRLSEIGQQLRSVESDAAVSGEEKRERIDELRRQRGQTAEAAAP